MYSRVCLRVLLVALGLHCACVSAGVLRRTTQLEADKQANPVAPRHHRSTEMETTLPGSSEATTQKSTSSATPGTESSSGQNGAQSQQPASESSTQAPTAAYNYTCPKPWSGHQWMGNCMKTYDIVNVTTRRTVCKDVPVEEERCTFQLSPACVADFSQCFLCYKVITGKRKVCVEENNVVPELVTRDRVHLNEHLGFINPVSGGQEHYSRSSEIVWQLEAMEGHSVYLELTHIDLHNEDGKCSDYIEVRFNPCTPPIKICDNRAKTYTWATSQSKVQVRFVSDHSQHNNGDGFRGAYYYYPVNTSIDPFEDAQRRLRETTSLTPIITARSTAKSRRRREVLKQLYASGMLAETRASSTEVIHHNRSQKAKSLPLTKRRLLCIGDILVSGKATKYVSDAQCQQLAKVFNTEGFYSP